MNVRDVSNVSYSSPDFANKCRHTTSSKIASYKRLQEYMNIQKSGIGDNYVKKIVSRDKKIGTVAGDLVGVAIGGTGGCVVGALGGPVWMVAGGVGWAIFGGLAGAFIGRQVEKGAALYHVSCSEGYKKWKLEGLKNEIFEEFMNFARQHDEPKDYICPISGDIFTTPVKAPDGRLYELPAIIEWLEKKPPSASASLERICDFEVEGLVPDFETQEKVQVVLTKIASVQYGTNRLHPMRSGRRGA